MIITKTPLRITFTGGGSDMPSYFNNREGHCINAAIDKFVYVLVNKRKDNKVYLKYSENEVVDVKDIDSIKHDFIRETLKYLNIDYGIEIINWADIPTKGSGLGSSGSFLVGLLNAIHHLEGNDVSKKMLVEQSSHIEMDLCNKPIGYQDQYAAAYGGMNEIIFKTNDIKIKKIKCDYNLISDNLLLFYTGINRDSSSVLQEQDDNLNRNEKVIEMMDYNVQLSKWLVNKIEERKYYEIGNALKSNWELKKNFSSNIINKKISTMYNKGIKAGARGGKIIGAGGGGFLMFYVEKEDINRFLDELCDYDFIRFKIEEFGSKVVLNT